MEMWMAAILLGLVFAGVFTLAEIIVGTIVLHRRVGGMVMLIPLKPGKGEEQLRNAVSWLEWQRGVFPGRVAAVNFGLGQEEGDRCRRFCRGSGVMWIEKKDCGDLESFVEKLNGMDYND